MKKCSKCKIEKPFTAFTKETRKGRGKNSPYRSQCRECNQKYKRPEADAEYYQRNKEKVLAKAKQYYKGNKEACNERSREYYINNKTGSVLDNRLKKDFGITLKDYNILLEEQNNVCKICTKPCRTGLRLSVDHDHKTGKVRGLLCKSCNVAIGHFKDDPENLYRAISYLNENKEKA